MFENVSLFGELNVSLKLWREIRRDFGLVWFDDDEEDCLVLLLCCNGCLDGAALADHGACHSVSMKHRTWFSIGYFVLSLIVLGHSYNG